MNKCIAAYTSVKNEYYPEYVNIFKIGNDKYEITVRGKQTDGGNCGDVVSMQLCRSELITLLHDAHDKLFEVAE